MNKTPQEPLKPAYAHPTPEAASTQVPGDQDIVVCDETLRPATGPELLTTPLVKKSPRFDMDSDMGA